MKMQTARMARVIGCEIVTVDALHSATGPPHPEVAKWFGSQGPFFEHYNAMENEDGTFNYVGVEKSLTALDETVEKLGPFDVALGFSQGATLLTMYIASLEKAEKQLPFRAAILLCGTFPRCKTPIFDYPNKILSLHVFGETDPLRPKSEELAKSYYQEGTRTVMSHKGGHMPPSGGQDECIQRIKEWMKINGL